MLEIVYHSGLEHEVPLVLFVLDLILRDYYEG